MSVVHVPESEFIEGIYLYCDRWCERCPLTARCRVYAAEEAALARDAASRDPQNAAFRQSLQHALSDAGEELQKLAAEQNVRVEPQQETPHDAPQHPLVSAAADYAAAVDDWFAARRGLFAEKQQQLNQQQRLGLADDDPGAAERIADAVEVVRWYQRLVAARLAAAMEVGAAGKQEAEPEPYPAGSAKVALIAIDRSVAAWTLLRRDLGACDDDLTLNLMLELNRLRAAIEQAVPDARAFQRPGFDA